MGGTSTLAGPRVGTGTGTEVGIGVLGTAYVVVDGHRLHLAAAKQRALLTLLAMHPGERVTTDTLVDVLWEDAPPAAAVATVRGYVVDLRRLLEPARPSHAAATVLVTEPGGYTLRVAPDAVDAGRLETAVRRAAEHLDLVGDAWRPAVAEADRTRAAEVVASLGAALDEWRGEPLADLGQHPDVVDERERLRALRLEAQVMRLAVLVGLRRHASAVVDLERLCRANPWHEQLWALRALALAGCGRQVEALAHLRQLRGALADQLGIDPDPEISRLETDLIRQDLPGRAAVAAAAHGITRAVAPGLHRGAARRLVPRRMH
jgi:DNA-binding SARP family transcriptional activator